MFVKEQIHFRLYLRKRFTIIYMYIFRLISLVQIHKNIVSVDSNEACVQRISKFVYIFAAETILMHE